MKRRWCQRRRDARGALLGRPRTIRYGIGENLYGMDAIRAFRRARSPVGLMRRIDRTVITTFGRDFATASTLFFRESSPGKVGRQQQSWARLAEGWRIVAGACERHR
jgi:hypothetical protein